MYKLNETEISESKANELIEDLAMFPYEQKDIELPVADRIAKYKSALEKDKVLKLSDALMIRIAH